MQHEYALSVIFGLFYNNLFKDEVSLIYMLIQDESYLINKQFQENTAEIRECQVEKL